MSSAAAGSTKESPSTTVKNATEKTRVSRKSKTSTKTWDAVLNEQRTDLNMSWADIFDTYRDPSMKPRGLKATADFKQDYLECSRCKVQFLSSHYYGEHPLCQLHRGGKDNK